MENIDIDMVIFDIDIDKAIMKYINIDKEILENIDIDKILNRLEFGISNRARWGWRLAWVDCIDHNFLP